MIRQDAQRYTDPDRVHRQFGLWLLLSLAMLAGLAGLGGLVLTGRMVAMPDWVTMRIEARLNAELAPVTLRLEGMDLMLSRATGPRVHFSDMTVVDGAGRDIARLPDLIADLSVSALARGQPGLRRLALKGAQVTLRRAPDGRFDLGFGSSGAPLSAARSLGELLDEMDRALTVPAFAGIEALSVESLSLRYEDARAGRLWRLDDGLLTLEQTPDEVALRAFFSQRRASQIPAELAFTFISGKGTPEARFSANFSDVSAADVASQSPALAALALIDAPISGAIRSQVDRGGQLGPLNASLEIGAGVLLPAGGAPPIRFAAGKSYFTYDPDLRRLRFDRIALDTAVLRLTAEGHAYLEGMESGWPNRMVGQLALRSVALDPAAVFETPAVFDGGAMDIQLDLDPLTATVGQAVLLDGDQAYRLRGMVRARPEGWQVAMDAGIDEITEARLLSLWPVDLAPETRRWFADNVIAAALQDVQIALRRPAGQPAYLALEHRFRDTRVRFLKTMPPITGGAGYAAIQGTSYTLVAEQGQVQVPGGGVLDMAGSVMRVPDVTRQDAPMAEFALRVSGTIPAALALLDLPPLQIPSDAGLSTDVGDGRAEVEARLSLPLKDGLMLDDVDYDVSARLVDVTSDSLVPGRPLRAAQLLLAARPDEVTISGPARVGGVPVLGRLQIARTAEGTMASRVEGTLDLSQDTATALGLGLPEGSLRGRATGRLAIDLPKGAVPRFTLDSDLVGLALRLPGVGWQKTAGTKAALAVTGTLGQTPDIDSLSLSAPGVQAEGQVRLAPGGGLAEARFDRVRLGDWLDGRAVISGQGADSPPRIAITGGTVDLRGQALSGGLSGAGSGRASAAGGQAIEISLDRLRITDKMQMTGVTGRLSTLGGLNGRVTGWIAGKTPLAITLVPAERGGTALRLRADQGGEALRDAGVFSRAWGGALDIVMQPVGEAGTYEGQLRLRDTRLRGMPVLAELLSAVSVVGIVDLMQGDGLVFSQVEAGFRLTPGLVQIRNASAVGPSLGLSLEGVYGLETNQLDMRGVISPIYLVNAIGSVLTRKGEGLFGFSFRLTGDADKPQTRVNPLSILTPGMLRDIFRGAAPKVAQ